MGCVYIIQVGGAGAQVGKAGWTYRKSGRREWIDFRLEARTLERSGGTVKLKRTHSSLKGAGLRVRDEEKWTKRKSTCIQKPLCIYKPTRRSPPNLIKSKRARRGAGCATALPLGLRVILQHTLRPVPVSNRYHVLHNLPQYPGDILQHRKILTTLGRGRRAPPTATTKAPPIQEICRQGQPFATPSTSRQPGHRKTGPNLYQQERATLASATSTTLSARWRTPRD